jgi:hypothetical protein
VADRGCRKKVPTAGKVPYHTFGSAAFPELTASESRHDGCLDKHVPWLLPKFHEHWCSFESVVVTWVKSVYGVGGVASPLVTGHAGGLSLSKWQGCIADIAYCVVLSLDMAGCMVGF